MQDAIISIKGMPGSDELGDEVIELVTDGEYSYNDGREATFSYMESELTGLEGTRTTFMIDRDFVTLTREGTVNSHMIFEEGRKHLSMYETPFGATTVGVDTKRVNVSLDEFGGDLEIVYSLDVNQEVIGRNKFKINVKKRRDIPPA